MFHTDTAMPKLSLPFCLLSPVIDVDDIFFCTKNAVGCFCFMLEHQIQSNIARP